MTFHFPQPVPFLNPARILPEGLRWYALISKTSREARAAHWLETEIEGCMTLVPLETRFRSKGKRGGVRHFRKVNAEYQLPLMARYVFAGFADQPNWLHIFNSPHITGAINWYGTPSEIPAFQVERFRDKSEAQRLAAGLPVLKIGTKARFVGDGVFQDHLLEIASLGAKSAEVWAEFLGAKRKIRVNRDDLEAA